MLVICMYNSFHKSHREIIKLKLKIYKTKTKAKTKKSLCQLHSGGDHGNRFLPLKVLNISMLGKTTVAVGPLGMKIRVGTEGGNATCSGVNSVQKYIYQKKVRQKCRKRGRVSNWNSTTSGDSAGLTHNRAVGTRLSASSFLFEKEKMPVARIIRDCYSSLKP